MANIALDNVLVLDLTRVVAGPYATMLLADMGATVIKIETPGIGDDARYFGPLFDNESPYFMNLNRNKKSITLNLKDSKGKELFMELVKQADIVVENYRPGVMDRLGLGYETLKQANPRIVYGAISGFGQFGPYKDRAGYDILGQAMSGLMSVTGWPGGKPTRVNSAIGDIVSGMSLAVGLLGAYSNSLKTGLGQLVDVSLVESLVSCLGTINHIYLSTGRVPPLQGNRDGVLAPFGAYACKDGSIIIACGNDKLFSALLKLMEREDLIGDPRFASNEARMAHNDELQAVIEAWLSTQTSAEAVGRILAAELPAGPIYSIDQVVNDPHIGGAREMFPSFEHEKLGQVRLTGSHLKMSDTPTGIRMKPPQLGEHNSEIYKSYLGMTEAEINTMSHDGII